MYDIVYSEKAEEDLAKLRRSEPAAFKKAVKMLNELVYHPRIGTGHPEPLKGDRSGQWSRTITKKHRLIYEIFETDRFPMCQKLIVFGTYDHKYEINENIPFMPHLHSFFL